MPKLFAAALIALLLPPTAADADARSRLGYGHLITNDFLGDVEDRERTGSVASSRVWGKEWNGALPQKFGELIELRLGVEVLAPNNLNRPRAGSRPYAGALSAGLHSHYQYKSLEVSAGAALYVTGPQTGLGDLQREFHDFLGEPQPSDSTLVAQIGNGFHPTLIVEAARSFDLTDRTRLRPFLEGQAGVETMMRAGFDFTFGAIGRGELLVRDYTSGHRYRVIQNSELKGVSFVLGADTAYVSDSVYLPEERGYGLADHRDRVRVGLHWQGESASAFYGVTWLGKEYETQPDDQIVGSLRINFSF